MSSRRIYIHAHSLRQICLSDRRLGQEILSAMIGVGVKKRLFNRLVQDGQMLLGLPADVLAPVQDRIGTLDGPSLSNVLRRLHYRPALPGRTMRDCPPRPVLEAGEEIVASCFDDNYYTFATDADAARRMYDDREPIKLLRRLLRESPGDPRVADLTLIRGDRLMAPPQAPCPSATPLAPEDLRALARAAQTAAARQVDALFTELDRALFPETYLGQIHDPLIDSIEDAARPLWGAGH